LKVVFNTVLESSLKSRTNFSLLLQMLIMLTKEKTI